MKLKGDFLSLGVNKKWEFTYPHKIPWTINNTLLAWTASSIWFFLLNKSFLAWGQASFKFGVVMTSHLSLVSLAFFFCFQIELCTFLSHKQANWVDFHVSLDWTNHIWIHAISWGFMLYLLHIMKEWISHDFKHSFDVFGWLMIGEESLEKGWSKKEWLGGREDKKLDQKLASNFCTNFWVKS